MYQFFFVWRFVTEILLLGQPDLINLHCNATVWTWRIVVVARKRGFSLSYSQNFSKGIMVNPWNRQDQKETYALQEWNIKYYALTFSTKISKFLRFLFLSELLKGNGKSLKQLMLQRAKKRALLHSNVIYQIWKSRIWCNISNMKI